MRRILASFVKSILAPPAENDVAAWSRHLRGNTVIAEGTDVSRARLTVRDATGCSLSIGSDSNIEASLVFEKSDASIHIGSRTHLGSGTLITAAGSIEIGDDVLVAFDALITDHNSHSLRFAERRNDVRNWIEGAKDWTKVSIAPVKISDKAWVGARAIMLKGITVGEGAVVGAGSVVTRDVPPWTIVAGNPAQIIRELSLEERR